MKLKSLILFFLVCIWQLPNLNAQNRIGLLGGLTVSNYTGRDFPKTHLPNLGIAAGLFVEYEITNPFSIIAEIDYDQKGVKYWDELVADTELTVKSKLNYISVPILVKMEFGRKLGYYAYAGTVLSYMLNYTSEPSVTINGNPTPWELYFENAYKKFDAGLTIGFGMVFKEIFLDIRYVHGVKNIYDGDNILDIRNQMITAKVGFSIYKRKDSRCYRGR